MSSVSVPPINSVTGERSTIAMIARATYDSGVSAYQPSGVVV
jgi:hypothetical protein